MITRRALSVIHMQRPCASRGQQQHWYAAATAQRSDNAESSPSSYTPSSLSSSSSSSTRTPPSARTSPSPLISPASVEPIETDVKELLEIPTSTTTASKTTTSTMSNSRSWRQTLRHFWQSRIDWNRDAYELIRLYVRVQMQQIYYRMPKSTKPSTRVSSLSSSSLATPRNIPTFRDILLQQAHVRPQQQEQQHQQQQSFAHEIASGSQHRPNRVAIQLLQMEKEWSLFRYHGLRDYMWQKLQQLQWQRRPFQWILSSTAPGSASVLSSSSSPWWKQYQSTNTLMAAGAGTPVQGTLSSTAIKPYNPTPKVMTTTAANTTTTVKSGRVAFMITAQMRKELIQVVGYDAVAIKYMTPQQAMDILCQHEQSSFYVRTPLLAIIPDASTSEGTMITQDNGEKQDNVSLQPPKDSNNPSNAVDVSPPAIANTLLVDSSPVTTSVQPVDGCLFTHQTTTASDTSISAPNTGSSSPVHLQVSIMDCESKGVVVDRKIDVPMSNSGAAGKDNSTDDTESMTMIVENTTGTAWYQIVEQRHPPSSSQSTSDSTKPLPRDDDGVVVAMYRSEQEAIVALETYRELAQRRQQQSPMTGSSPNNHRSIKERSFVSSYYQLRKIIK